MAGYLVTNAQPRGYALGFKDESRGVAAPDKITTPQFYPLMWILAQRTYDEAIVLTGNGDATLGPLTLSKGSAYYTHQNAFLKKLLSKGNPVVVETIKLPGSAKAFLRVSIEVVASDIPVNERVSNENDGRIGEYKVDELGGYTQTGTLVGSKLVHHAGVGFYADAEKPFGAAKIRTCRPSGTIVGDRMLSSIVAGPQTTAVVADGATSTTPLNRVYAEVSSTDPTTDLSFDLTVGGVFVKSYVINPSTTTANFYLPADTDYVLSLTQGSTGTFGAGLTVKSTPINSAATTLYPIADIELTAYGASGDLTGASILSPTTRDENGPFINDLKLNRAVSYRFVTQRKATQNVSAQPVYLLTGDQALDATLKLETVSSLTKNPISLAKTLVPAYSRKMSLTAPAVYGEWGRVKVYDQSLETLLLMLANGYTVAADNVMVDVEGEGSWDTDPVVSQVREDWAQLSDPLNTHLINIFSGVDHNAVPYGSFTTSDSVALGGINFSSGAPQFASGGCDGIYYYSDGRPAKEVNAKIFDDAVRYQIQNFGAGLNKYKDALRYPITNLIDSGFSLETKLEYPGILSKRPDMYVIAATHSVYDLGQSADPNTRSIYRDGDVNDVANVQTLVSDWGVCPQQSQIQEDAYGSALKAAFNTTMESDFYATPVTRGILRGQSGVVIEDGIWDGFLPLTYELMCQLSDFAGDPSGIWRESQDFTIEPNNIIKLMDNINNTYRENDSYSKLWDIGVNWSSSYDQIRFYTPAVQTVYPYDDSVLNSAKMMMACCRLEYVNLIVHSRLTGRDDLTDDEFIQKTKKIAEEEVDGIFAGKYIVESKPQILESDKQKGFIWRNFFYIYGNVMKTAMIYGVIAKRMSDYTGSSN